MKFVASLAIVLLATSPYAWSAPESATQGSGLEGLGSDLLGDDLLDRLLPPEPQAPPADLDGTRDQLQQDQGSDVGESPLVKVEQKMRSAGELIQRRDVSGETADVQTEIVDELDKLIEQLDKQCKSCSSGQCNKPSSSSQQTAKAAPKPGSSSKPSTQKPGGPAQPKPAQQANSNAQAKPQGGAMSAAEEAVDPQAMLKEVWGQLPERLRQQMLQSTADEFLPEYRDDIEAYYRRLAEPAEGQK